MPIVEALLKYGQNNFALLIVEYVDAKELTLRETVGGGPLSCSRRIKIRM